MKNEHMNMNIDKHAYLIIAHHHFDQLQTLISLLDDPRNDIYIHVDKKAKDFSPDMLRTRYAGLILLDRIGVSWGGHSMMTCEMNLLKAAAPKHYRYYHLLSGDDLPLKTQDEVHDFFQRNAGKNYIRFEPISEKIEYRIRYFHLLQDYIGRTTKKNLLRLIEIFFLKLQRMFGIHRVYRMPIYKGSQWFSISDRMVHWLLTRETLIKKQFRFTNCADEMFLHSIAMTSPYRDSIINDDLRAIDWNRGEPYTYHVEDVKELLESECLFARKFDGAVAQGAIDEIERAISGQQLEAENVLLEDFF